MTGKIFINYRRGEDSGFAQALFAHLVQGFPREQLFMDVDSIEPGLDFVRVLNDQVAKCDILISMVGKNWTDAREENGARRLDNPDDFVRVEIEAALQQDKRVIPVLIGQAQMPRADQLPDTLKPFARRNAIRLTHERFGSDTQVLITALQRALNAEDTRSAQIEDAAARRRAETGTHREVEEARQRREQPEAKRRAEEETRGALGSPARRALLRLSRRVPLAASVIFVAALAAISVWLFRTPGPGAVSALSSQQERALQPKDSFKECTHCPQMIVVPAGSFTMGSPTMQPGRRADEGPQHEVTIASLFAVSTYAVTRDEFAAFVADTGYDTGSKCIISLTPSGSEKESYSWRNAGFEQTGSHPAVCVSWSDAQRYVDWLSKKTGKSYHLLSESQWEYAARAASTTTYYWGEVVGKNNANCSGCGSQWDNNGTSPVGSFKPNAFGLYDMAGNVWSWTEDCHHNGYAGAPADGSAWTSGDCSSRDLRGGSWNWNPIGLRSANRLGLDAGRRAYDLGFRIGRALLTP
jgi:formylglycine-generating enzyme required for sulfatase activity